MEKNTKTFSSNRFLAPIVASLSWEQLYYFIVLLGILPSIVDSSLFRILWTDGSKVDFLWGGTSLYETIIYGLPAILLPIGLSICFKKKNFWMLLGLLPAIVGFGALGISEVGVIINTPLISKVLFGCYKIAFLYFVMKGKIRSISFYSTVLLALLLCMVWQMEATPENKAQLTYLQIVLFVFLIILFKTVYLVITQNLYLLTTLERKKLIGLVLKAFFAWSTLLLFAIPGYVGPKVLTNKAIKMIYDETFVDSFNMSTKLTIPKIIASYSVLDTLQNQGLDTSRHELIGAQLRVALRVVQGRADSLKYHDYSEGVVDFNNEFSLYVGPNASTSTSYLANSVSQDLEKVLVKRFLPGRTDFEIDVELSILNEIAEGETDAKNYADSLHNKMENDLDSIQYEAKATSNSLDSLSKSNEARIDSLQEGKKNELQAYSNSTYAGMLSTSETTLTGMNAAITRRLDSLPNTADRIFEQTVPRELTDIIPGFKNNSCGWNPICPFFNWVKGLMREAYRDNRRSQKKALRKEMEEFSEKCKRQVSEKTGLVNTKITERVNGYQSTTDSLINNADTTSLTFRNDVFQEIDARRVETDSIVEAEFENIGVAMDSIAKETHNHIEKIAQTVSTITKTTTLAVSKVLDLSELWSQILLALLIINSYLYVFSRFAFSENYDLFVEIKGTPKSFKNGTLMLSGSEYQIPVENKTSMFISRKYMPTGRAPKVAIPLWTSGIVGRIRAGVYLMNEIEVRENETETVDFRSMAGAEFVEWNLSEGEEVVFDYEDLVALSETLKLETYISFRVSSLIFGTPVFKIARGPGKLVLSTRGKPITDQDKHLIKSVPIERIIAWQSSTRFSIDSELNFTDLYFSGLYLKRTNEDLIIIDADIGNTRRKGGIVRFVKRFLLLK